VQVDVHERGDRTEALGNVLDSQHLIGWRGLPVGWRVRRASRSI
jgi:hypothetical protein